MFMSLMEHDRINANCNVNVNVNVSFYDYNNDGWGDTEYAGINTSSPASVTCFKVFPISSPSTSSSSSSSPTRYIEHQVTKFDTLAGLAIRYGVEVADIRKMNGLVTDLHMFALKTLHIPLLGKHPQSPCSPNGHSSFGGNSPERTPTRTRSDFLESFHSLRLSPKHRISPTMTSLQGYYGLGGGSSEMVEDELFMASSSSLSLNRKSRSVASGFNSEDSDPTCGYDNATIIWRRLKSEADVSRTPEKLLKEDQNWSGISWFSLITGKGLALKNKGS